MKKITIVITVIFIVTIWAGSAEWVRFNIAGLFEQRGERHRAIKIYEKILRKSEVGKKNPLFSLFKQRLTAQQKYELAKLLADHL